MERQRGFEKSSSDPEKQKRHSTNSEKTKLDPEKQKEKSALPEKIKNETSRFHPVESNAILNREKNTEHQSPDTNEPRDVSNAKPEGNFGPGWAEKQLQIISGNLKNNELSQKPRDQTIEADARDRQDETATLNSSKESLTQQTRKSESNYRLHVDHMNHMLRAKL
jgi:hypothetical protein